MSAYVKTVHLDVGYDGKPLLRDVTLELKKGEILTLIGPNGAGKSTLLKTIAGQLQQLGGMVYIDGRALAKLSAPALAKKLAVVFTQRLRTELMTCADVVATGRYPYTGRFGVLSPADEAVVAEAMELVQVTQLRACDFTKLSDGQRQRVLLARALAQEPEVIVLDEPTSFLDVKYKLEFLSLLQMLRQKKGLTVVLSLHELELAARVSDRLLCVKHEKAADGSVRAQTLHFGTPEELFQPGVLQSLFEIQTGSFDEVNGSMELAAPCGVPRLFVIAGGGSGRAVYRRLQRAGRAFLTGILYENDLDLPTARALAADVIVAPAFEPMENAQLLQAKQALDACEQVICTRKAFGSLEWANEELLAYAHRCGKVVEQADI